MSMASCTNCGRLVDTDDDCEFYFIEDEYGESRETDGFCEKCRGEP